MTNELKKLRRELDATKSALQAQASRCRQLVAAFTRKLQEKEKELRASNDLRDRQLACVLRSLITLESRLRKEQKLIRQQLLEKDRLIAQQSSELAQLRQSPSGETRLDNLCHRPIYNDAPLTENAYRDNPVLESVQQILLKDEEDLLTVQHVDNCDKKNVQVGVAWYETDSTVSAPEQSQQQQNDEIPAWCQKQDESWTSLVPDRHQQESSGAWCIKVIEEGDEPLPTSNGHERLWVKDKPSAQHLEEKACLQMAKKNLAIAVPKDLDEIEANSITVLESSYQELSPVTLKPQQQQQQQQKQKPPALPPKPTRLLKPSEILKQSETFKAKPEMQPKPRVHVQEIKRKQMNGHVPGNAKMQPAVESKPQIQSEPEIVKKPQQGESPKQPTEPSIRIGSSVSSLITGSARESIVTELTTTLPASDDALHENFEEFKLEECYVESDDGRPEADGAEMNHYAVLGPQQSANESTRTYETFLETTGLSQKSILTPSRMLSNHRSCLKPKDVKHRSRIKAAAVGIAPTVKYWTEPFL